MTGETREKNTEDKSGGRDSWKEGLEPLTIGVTPDAKAKLEEIARETGMSVSQAGSVIFQAQIEKHTKLEDSIRKTISDSIDKEYTRIEEELVRINQPTERFNNLMLELFPLLKEKLQKKGNN